MYDYLPRSLELRIIMLNRRISNRERKIKYDGQVAYINKRGYSDDAYNVGIYKNFNTNKLALTAFSGSINF